MLIENIVKVVFPMLLSFAVGILVTPVLTKYLYKYKIWKKNPGKSAFDGSEAKVFNSLCADRERHVPRMGGIVIWSSVVITILLIAFLSSVIPVAGIIKLTFLSRSQTWIPLMTLITGAFVGLLNDYWDVYGHGEGLSLKRRLLFVALMSAFVGWWFYAKLGVTEINIPFDGGLEIGFMVIPFFILMSLAIYASGVIDGIDGLSGGVFMTIFAAYTGIALYQNQIDLAAFSAAILGGILAFVWFNIPPARFFMTETGTMALTMTLSVLAFMTDSLGGGIGIAALPIIGALLVVTVLSNLIQVFYKKFTGKKFFKIAPLHHHFEAIGWPSYKVAMRYWVLSIMFSVLGFIFALIA